MQEPLSLSSTNLYQKYFFLYSIYFEKQGSQNETDFRIYVEIYGLFNTNPRKFVQFQNPTVHTIM